MAVILFVLLEFVDDVEEKALVMAGNGFDKEVNRGKEA